MANGQANCPAPRKKTVSATASYVGDVGNGWDFEMNARPIHIAARQQERLQRCLRALERLLARRVSDWPRDDLENFDLFQTISANSDRPISRPGGQNQVPYPRTIGVSFEKRF